MAMTTAVVGLAQLLSELGLSTATVQRQQITHAQVNALFWIQAAIGVVVAVLAVLLAPAVEAFYGVTQVAVVVIALAVTFVLRGASAQHQALLERRLQFRRLARIELVSSALSTGAAIAVALLGGGFWALVTLNVSYVLARSLQLWTASGWLPGLPRPAVGLWSLLTFGGHLSVFNVVNYTARNADNVLIGRFIGADALGLYDRAYRLLMLPLQQINGPVSRVAVPTLSRVVHEDTRLRRYYITAVGGVSLASMPLMAVAAVLASPLVVVVLGDQWAPAAPIFRALAIVGLVDTVAQTNGWLYSATGRTKQQAQWALISRPLVVLGFVAGLPWGPLGVAVGYAVVGIVLTVPGFLWSVRGTPVTAGGHRPGRCPGNRGVRDHRGGGRGGAVDAARRLGPPGRAGRRGCGRRHLSGHGDQMAASPVQARAAVDLAAITGGPEHMSGTLAHAERDGRTQRTSNGRGAAPTSARGGRAGRPGPTWLS